MPKKLTVLDTCKHIMYSDQYDVYFCDKHAVIENFCQEHAELEMKELQEKLTKIDQILKDR